MGRGCARGLRRLLLRQRRQIRGRMEAAPASRPGYVHVCRDGQQIFGPVAQGQNDWPRRNHTQESQVCGQIQGQSSERQRQVCV